MSLGSTERKSQSLANPFELISERIINARRPSLTAAALMVGYVAVWTLYGVLAKGSQDIHFDMGEMFAWSREPALGYAKHPPLSAWLVGAWFSVFPRADWAYYLLAMSMAALGLWIAWAASRRWLDREKQFAALAFLTFIPFFNFHALKFNANTVLIPTWAATMFFFLRSLEKRDAALAAAAGLAAAAAMLGKYWSVVLLIGLGLVALTDPRRKDYFRSPAPWVTIAVGLVILAPHLAWLVAHDFEPFGYATNLHTADSFWSAAIHIPKFLGGTLAYIAVPLALTALFAQRNAAAARDILWPAEPERRLAVKTFWAPLLVSICVAILGKTLINSLWTMPMFTLLGVVLLSSPFVSITRRATIGLLTGAILFPVVATTAAPLVAYAIHVNGSAKQGAHYRMLADATMDLWRSTTTAPLRLIGGDQDLADGTVFYLAGNVSAVPLPAAHPSPAEARRPSEQGAVLICPAQDAGCVRQIEAVASGWIGSKRKDVELARNYFGHLGNAGRYLLVAVPPDRHP